MRPFFLAIALVLAGAPGSARSQDGGAPAILGRSVPEGTRQELSLVASESFLGSFVSTPVIIIRGTRPGSTLCLFGGVHGDELNGIEIVRRSLETVEAEALRGTVVGVPIANIHGFRRSSRYLPDRRDLNRYFPGNDGGSAASRIAFQLFDGIVRHCDRLVDFHTGSFHRRNLPQIRADLRDEGVREMALDFGGGVVVHSVGTRGTLRRAAVEVGIPAITYEAGKPMELQEAEVERGVLGVRALLERSELVEPRPRMAPEHLVFLRSRWVRSDHGGILISRVGLGEDVDAGDPLGTVTDPITNERTEIVSPYRGQVIGMAVNQFVIPGFAAYHVGVAEADQPPGLQPVGAAAPADDEGDVLEEIDPLDEPVELDERLE